ncbi:MAG: aldose 1-epimerase family protein [Bacilli bacterium]
MKIIENKYLKARIAVKGAELKSLIYNDKEYIWPGQDGIWNRSAPLLFPIVGSLKDKTTYINSKPYSMSQHGFLRDQKFSLLKCKKNEIKLVNLYDDNTLKMYPFKYKAVVTYKLFGKKIRTQIEIFNLDMEELPFNIGGHPGITCPIYKNETFEDYSIIFQKKETFNAPSVNEKSLLDFDKVYCSYENLKKLPLKYSYFDIDAIIIPEVKSSKVKLFNKSNKGIEFNFPKFKSLALWTAPKKEANYICLEPWIGYADKANTKQKFIEKDNIIKLKQAQKFKIYYDIKIVD